MSRFSRTDISPLSRWWWQIDRWILSAVFSLAVIGIILVIAASPAVAERIGTESWHFVKKQTVFLILSMLIITGVSMLPPAQISILSVFGFIGGILILLLLPFIGETIKGATRWISILGISLQPSEFLKPFFIIVTAWILSRKFPNVRSGAVSFLLFLTFASLLVIQPDLGTTVLISVIWGIQLFISGAGIIWIIMLSLLGCLGAVFAYFTFPHFKYRIDSFFNPETVENYQLKKSLDAFSNGKFFGKGMGEGTVKSSIPDAHTDFIFAVAGEEFGIILCLIILALFTLIVLRSFYRIKDENSKFIVIGTVGLASQLGLQAYINMSVTLNIMPTKGMTLPFVSYGGSSLLALSFTVGILLAFTKKKYGFAAEHNDD